MSRKTMKKPVIQTNPVFHKSKLYVATVLALSALSPLGAHAQNIYEWVGGTDNDVINPDNWVERGPSASGMDEVIINTNTSTSGAPQWILDSNTPFPFYNNYGGAYLTIGSGVGSNGELLMIRPTWDEHTNSTTASLNELQVGVDGGKGVLTLDMNQADEYNPNDHRGELITMYLESSDRFALGVGAGSEGTINILGTGKSIQEQAYYNRTGLSVNGATDTEFRIGAEGGKGKLNIDGGVFSVQTVPVLLGSGSGSTGEINVLAGGKIAQNVYFPVSETGDYFVVGDDGGLGILRVSGRSDTKDISSRVVSGSGLVVGSGSGSVGEVYITQGAQIQSAVGSDSQTGYGRHVVGDNGGTGRVVIDGQDSIWKVLGETSGLVNANNGTGDGELYVGHSGAGEISVSNGGTLSIGTSKYGTLEDPETGDYIASHTELEHTGGTGSLYLGTESGGNGTLSIGGALGAAAQGTGVVAVKDIQFGDGEGTVHFNHTDNTGNYEFDTALISGAGQSNILHSNGVTLFNTDQSLFTGKTTITGGHLIVDSTLGGNIEVNGRGTLGGIGNVGDVVLNSGGTLAPGGYNQNRLNPPTVATLTTDSATFNSGSRMSIQGSPSGHIDVLKATTANGGTGEVTLNSGSGLYIQAGAGTWALNTKYVFIEAEGGVTGTFSNVGSNLAFLTSQVGYESNDAFLYLTRNNVGFDDIGNTYNERSTGKGIGSLQPGDAVYDTIVSMSADEANRAYNNLSGEIHANVKGALLTGTRHTRMAVNNHLGSGLQLDEITPQKNLWVDAWGHTGTIDNDGNSSELDTQGYGFLMGWDAYQNGSTTLGVAAGYEHNKVDADHIRKSKADTDMLHLMAYGTTSVGPIDLKGGIGYAWLDIETEREITVPGLEGKHKADYNGNLVQAFIEGSHTFKLSEQLGVTPYAGLAYQRVKTNSATEKGGNADTALHYHGGSDDLMSGTLGVRAQWQVSDKAQIYGDLGWQNNFGNNHPTADLNFRGSSTYDVKGSNLNSNSAIIGIGAQFKTGERSMVRIGYDGEYGNNAKSHGVHVNWELRF